MSAGTPVAIGLDVGGTKLAGGLVDPATGEVLARRERPTDAGRGGQAVLDDAMAIGADLWAAAGAGGRAVSGIGVGVAELVDVAGEIGSDGVLGWQGLPVRDWLALGGLPVRVEADVRAGALAETRFGAGRGAGVVAYVSIGTGISSTLVIDGVPFAGARGNALVLASGPRSVRCPVCGETSTTVLEEIASGDGIAARFTAATGRATDGARGVIAAAAAGSPAARAVLIEAATALGSAIGQLVDVTDPDLVVLGGGLGAAPGPFRELLVPAIRRHVWSPATRELPIVPAALGADSGLVGAGLVGAATADAHRWSATPARASPAALTTIHPLAAVMTDP